VSAGAAQGLVRRTAAEDGIEVDGHFGAVGAMREKLVGGEPCDVVILTRALIADLVKDGYVALAGIADLGGVDTSIAVRAADAPPDVHDASALRETLRAADALYFPDPAKATAGVHFAHVLRMLGVHDELAPRFRTAPHGAAAMAAMAQAGGKPLGCTQATEILATPGVKLVAPLPPGLELRTVYTAAVSATAANPSDAARFVERLASAELAAARASAGFAEPGTDPLLHKK